MALLRTSAASSLSHLPSAEYRLAISQPAPTLRQLVSLPGRYRGSCQTPCCFETTVGCRGVLSLTSSSSRPYHYWSQQFIIQSLLIIVAGQNHIPTRVVLDLHVVVILWTILLPFCPKAESQHTTITQARTSRALVQHAFRPSHLSLPSLCIVNFHLLDVKQHPAFSRIPLVAQDA